MADDFSGKVVIITGSSSGIGEDAAVSFAQLGAQVVVTGRSSDRVGAVAKRCDEVSPNGSKALPIVADVAVDADLQRIVDQTVEHSGRIDILVNNAGIYKRATVESPEIADTLDELFRTNVRAVVKLTQLAVPHLLKTKGNIINLSSVASTKAAPGGLPYNVSKAAVDMMTKVMALELSPQGVRVNAINPALIITPLISKAFGANGVQSEAMDQMQQAVANTYPMRRVGEVSDTSRAILFLASERSSFYTGVCLPVDGGSLATSVSATSAIANKN
jgi:NAD(P)-dependent dehydrogenase (short-subunit alcohol dehydrogenase family)